MNHTTRPFLPTDDERAGITERLILTTSST